MKENLSIFLGIIAIIICVIVIFTPVMFRYYNSKELMGRPFKMFDKTFIAVEIAFQGLRCIDSNGSEIILSETVIERLLMEENEHLSTQ